MLFLCRGYSGRQKRAFQRKERLVISKQFWLEADSKKEVRDYLSMQKNHGLFWEILDQEELEELEELEYQEREERERKSYTYII